MASQSRRSSWKTILRQKQLLTINADEYILQKQVQQLKEKNQVSDNSIKKELSEVKRILEEKERSDNDIVAGLGDKVMLLMQEIEKLKKEKERNK